MKKFSLFALLLVSSAFAGGYDSSWYRAPFWSGEYPAGFSVVKRGLVVQGRTAADTKLARSVHCELPFAAVIQPWNETRNQKSQISYVTFSKITPFTAKSDFNMAVDFESPVAVKAGEKIEYLVYLSEGYFRVRFKGVEYDQGQDLFDHLVEDVSKVEFQQDEWIKMKCENGKNAWLFLTDLTSVDGIGDMGPGFQGYGDVRDLTAAEADELARQPK